MCWLGHIVPWPKAKPRFSCIITMGVYCPSKLILGDQNINFCWLLWFSRPFLLVKPHLLLLRPLFPLGNCHHVVIWFASPKRRRTHAPVRPVVRPRWWRYPRQPGGWNGLKGGGSPPKKKNRKSSNPRLYLSFGTLWSSSLHHLWKMFVKVTHFITWNEAVRDDGPCNNFWIGPHSTQLWWGRGSFAAASVSNKKVPSVRQVQRFQRSELRVHWNVCKKSPAECVEFLSTSAPWQPNQTQLDWIAIQFLINNFKI